MRGRGDITGYDPDEERKPTHHRYHVKEHPHMFGGLRQVQVCRNGTGIGLITIESDEELEWIRERLTGSRKLSEKELDKNSQNDG